MIDALVRTPTSWTVVAPPPGVALVAVEPTATDDGEPQFRANIVVTMIDRPIGDDVDAYLENVLAHLLADLDDAEVVEVLTIPQPIDLTSDEPHGPGASSVGKAQPTLGQRLIVLHRVGELAVETVQQHTWIDDTVVIVTATVPEDRADDLAPVLCDCLGSVSVAA